MNIPYGKENGLTKKELMARNGILNEEVFYNKLDVLREQTIILIDKAKGKYYRPTTKKEYLDFIQKNNERCNEINKLIMIAYEEMKRI